MFEASKAHTSETCDKCNKVTSDPTNPVIVLELRSREIGKHSIAIHVECFYKIVTKLTT